MVEPLNYKNNSLNLPVLLFFCSFDKYCISVKKSVYLKSLIAILMSHASRMNWRSEPISIMERDFRESLVRSLACVPPISLPSEVDDVNERHVRLREPEACLVYNKQRTSLRPCSSSG